MSSPDVVRIEPTPGLLFRGQGLHALFLLAMVPAAWALAQPALDGGSWLGVGERGWFVASIAVAVAHQVYVWLGWRLQLGWQAFTRVFGRADFAVWCLGFFPLLFARPLLVFAVGMADGGSLALPYSASAAIGLVLLLPALYVFASIRRYFGFGRAAGGDHFREAYRAMPLVDQGAFAWTPNAMYTVAFFGLWGIALLAASHGALVAALFQHGYIWAHYLATEQPDMELLYGSR